MNLSMNFKTTYAILMKFSAKNVKCISRMVFPRSDLSKSIGQAHRPSKLQCYSYELTGNSEEVNIVFPERGRERER